MQKKNLIGIIVIIITSFLIHSIYDNYPSLLTSVFFPVNESIWEHNKMILSSYLVWTMVEKIIYKNEKTITKNFIMAIICIILVTCLFSPIYLIILDKKHNMFITLTIYIISIITSFVIGNKIKIKKEKYGILGFLISYLLFFILMYYPLKLDIFYDFENNYYGINK